jgi:hypothetical protein
MVRVVLESRVRPCLKLVLVEETVQLVQKDNYLPVRGRLRRRHDGSGIGDGLDESAQLTD